MVRRLTEQEADAVQSSHYVEGEPMEYLNSELVMTEAQFRALPREALLLLEDGGCRHQWVRLRTSGEYRVVVSLPAELMDRLVRICRPALEE